MRTIHAALDAYNCTIGALVVTGDRAAARMTFEGRHRGDFFGMAPAGKTVRWAGASFFRMAEDRIAELWVLGDVDSVKQQLGGDASDSF